MPTRGTQDRARLQAPSLNRSRRRWAASVSAVALALGLTACTSSEDTRPAPGASKPSSNGFLASPGGSGDPYPAILQRADAFKAALTEKQRAQLLQPYTFENASNWHTYPQWYLGDSGRVGLDLGTLSDEQWDALNALLAAATGTGKNEGFDEIQQHLTADDHLRQIGAGDGYGRGDFRVAFLGKPSPTGAWQLQFGGHHLALSNTYSDGALVGATPSFRGIEPLDPFRYQGNTYAPERQEHQAFVTLLDSLNAAQRVKAELDQKFADVLLAPGKDWAFPATPEGIAVSSLSDRQRALVIAAITHYVQDIDDADAAAILKRYQGELDETYLSYSGSTSMTSAGDYVRIDGPSLWLEMVMDTPYTMDKPHPHAVWRDKTTDYGGLGRAS
ncbi:DUF3500 domain-containing protein [Sphaerisporangium sp. NPDC051011]|uniref:DUF3500 domain-containing protein n=1 Tax=Sphaerisporangium sp. NPDC051011 TaxID=3155792 RepID=UPI0033BFD45C